MYSFYSHFSRRTNKPTPAAYHTLLGRREALGHEHFPCLSPLSV
jgi:hypothetical protein